MAVDKSLFIAKRFLKARTPEALVREQVRNNLKFGKTFTYDIVHDGKQWFAWYLFDHTELFKIAANTELLKVRGTKPGGI